MLKKIKPLQFVWDKYNKFKNWEKHKVSYKECEEVFFNKPVKTLHDAKHSEAEKRLVIFGKTDKKRKLYIVFTIRNKKIRIISARNMSKKERSYYGKKQKTK